MKNPTSRYLLTVALLALATPASSQAVTKLQVSTSGWPQARVSLVRLDTSDEVDGKLNGAEYVIETNGPPDAQTLKGKLIVQDDQQAAFFHMSFRPPLTPRVLQIAVPRAPEVTAANTGGLLDAIDRRQLTPRTLVKSTLEARAIYYAWKYALKNPDHLQSIRALRLWFDHAYELAKPTASAYYMDPDVIAIINELYERANRDVALRSRMEQVFPNPRYVAGILVQVASMELQPVALVKTLIADGNIKAAEQINSKAIAFLDSQSAGDRATFSKTQGVTSELLRRNAVYIETLRTMKEN